MWSAPLVLLSSLILIAGVSALVLPDILAAPSPAIDQPRDILGILAGDLETTVLSNPLPTRPIIPVSKAFTKTTTSPPGEPTFIAPRTSTYQPTSAVTTSAKPADRTTYAHPSSSLETTTPSESATLPVSTATQLSDPNHTSKTWQAVGIVFISILFVATAITCAMFFDRLWRFFKDVFCGKTRPNPLEEFIPDSESHSWDMASPSPSLTDLSTHSKAERLAENPSGNTRELPWNSDSQTWNTLHRQPSRRNDHRAIA